MVVSGVIDFGDADPDDERFHRETGEDPERYR
jgi:hypothetical protein